MRPMVSRPQLGRRRLPIQVLAALTLVVLGAPACGGSDDKADGGASAAERGRELVREHGCVSCHSLDGSDSPGPTFEGLAGSTVELEDGSFVTADDAYLTESIVAPGVRVVAGYSIDMPRTTLEPDEVRDVVAFLRTLGS